MLGWVAAGLGAGVAGAGWVAGSLLPLAALPLLLLKQVPEAAKGPLLLLLILAPGAWWAEVRRPVEAPGAVSREAPRRFIRLAGTLATPPVAHRDGWRSELAAGSDRLLITFQAPAPPRVGDRWRFAGRLSRPRAPGNPGEFDYPAFLARRGIFATCQAEDAVRLGVDPAYAGARRVDDVRQRLLAGLSSGLDADQAALLGSLVLGSGAAPVSEETEQAFRRAGLSHLLAASGAQVALLAGMLYGAGRWLRLPPGLAAALTAPGLLAYLALTGAPPSMVRATVMGLVGLGAIALHKREVPFSALWVAAVAMLLWDPACLHDLGFQFSFLATYGLMRLGYALSEAELPGPRWAYGFVLVPVVAWAWVTPWQASIFQTWTPYSLPANWLASALILALTPWGLGVAAIGAVYAPGAALLNGLTGPAIAALTTMVEGFARLPGAEMTAPGLSPCTLAALYGALWCGWARRRLALLLAILGVLSIPMRPPAVMQLSVLSVGQGDAIAVRTPGGRWVVVDGGLAAQGVDMGARVVVPYLRREGCRAIDLLVATHAHADHIGGLSAVSRAFPVHQAWEAGQAEPSAAHQTLLGTWLTQGIPWEVPRPGRLWSLDGVRLEVLGPSAPGASINDGSLVLKLTHGAFTALLAGDMEAEGEARLLRRGREVQADVLKVGHHGSRSGTSTPWLRAVRPRLAIVSVGARNMFRHPHAEVMTRLRRTGAIALRTDRDGAVIIRSDGRHWRYATGIDQWRRFRSLRYGARPGVTALGRTSQ